MLLKIKIFRDFVGAKAFKYLFFSILIGIFWFIVESSFIWVIQAFLFSLKLMPKAELKLPDFIPLNPLSTSLILILYGLARAILSWLKIHSSTVISVVYTSHKRRQFIERLLGNPRLSTHEMMVNFSDNIETSSAVILQFSQMAVTATSTGLFFILGLKIAPKEMLIGVGALFFLLFPLKLINRKVDELATIAISVRNNLTKNLIITIRNIFLLQIYGILQEEKNKKTDLLLRFEDTFQKYSKFSATKSSLPLFLGVMIISVITFFSREFWGTEGVTLISFFYIFIRLAQSCSELSGTLVSFRMSWPVLMKLYQFEKDYLLPIIDNDFKSFNISLNKKEKVELIEVENLAFSYGKIKVFEHLSFNVSKNQTMLIKGPSGSGKSTIIKILTGLQKPSQGRLKINGQKLDDHFSWMRDQLGYVGPEPFLIPGTLRENLVYGLTSQVTDDELISACNKSKLTEVLASFKDGLNEYLYEDAQLSTGQKQRIALARALARKPSILILDEATANLDEQTESEIIKEIFELKNDKIIIVISHKSSFDSVADKVLTLTKYEES
jgi:ABC-type multidrug transport system fused ATPase/permease subunit